MSHVYKIIAAARKENRKLFAVLIDPDDLNDGQLTSLMQSGEACVDLIFVGGSLVRAQSTRTCIDRIKEVTGKPVVLFPGSILQVVDNADALFFLSLISGRNPEMLIGNHVIAAPMIKQTQLEVIPTGYMLIDGGQATTVSYISNTFPIPRTKYDIAACTAMAGELLGLKVLYMDAGSGAKHPIPPEMISAVRQSTDLPIIAGGGICTPEQVIAACHAGADVIVVGNAIESNSSLLDVLGTAVKSA
ncbi:MAG: geranylgeranylglyceryl/heptaprenylglyceryl phosphate synthase [Flavobacteriales bacterium]|nr:geranylgeranylglyceryl/heptaprenylglyceryl phosphate synthase [Flavobacteriales bacterium]MCB9448415.1 geranylgeranylglyceryl/heptaprenylglyceryl phosphate synthase [Flavobacteriales bacterium]